MSDVKCQMSNVASKGYTLIELMVAIGVFAIVVGIMSSMLTTSLRGQKKSITAQNMADNVRFAMEMISKEIRMGKTFSADNNGGACGITICRLIFTSTMPNRYGKTVTFYFNNNLIMFDDDINNLPAAAAITSSQNISVSSLTFDVTNTDNHPRVTVVVQAASVGTKSDVATSYDIQTTISPRSS